MTPQPSLDEQELRTGMHSYDVVDAFAREPLLGNPVAVFYDSDDLSARTMQRIAQEMHLSETTFVLRPRDGGDARIRIFTPVNELPFAGHPLLGTAMALGARREGDRLRLETAMGTIPFDLVRDQGKVVAARMRQPVPTWESFDRADELLAALGVEKSTLPVEIYRNGPRHVFVGLDDVPALSAVQPDHRALADFDDMAVNCFAGRGTSWRSRMFSPAYGVVEDAATGSAAGPLAIHLARHGRITHGTRIEITQGVEIGRPSLMLALAEGAADHIDTVEVGGDAVLVAQGALHV
ncbi:PhzF family phenazine biosynthesis isomerase [Streptomyces sp. NPDC048441]|uniref:PhzF family phenazine biosynthesis isomerase n=1 Tax=Streptomyces sp. NPDC048441 TaxID=3365552 RepID=UPI003719655D